MVPYPHGRLGSPERLKLWALVLPFVVAFVAVGALGTYRYVDNYWLYRGFAPPKDAAWVTQHGRQESIEVVSPALGGRTQQAVVYLPPGYDAQPSRRFPVVYLLHGFPGRPLAFLQTVRAGVLVDELVGAKKMQPVILVMPFGSTSTFEDKEWANGVLPGQGWETFVARDLVRTVDARYRTIPSAAGRALAGLSEGGYGALNIGFHHPGTFRVLESWSGYMRAADISAIFGHTPSLLAYNSPSTYLPRAAAALRRNHVYIWLYTGTKDEFRAQNVAFARQLAQYRIPHTFFVVSGGHTWVAWRDNAAAALRAAAARLSHG
ncbi:MAG TPA: alpha/beta hydrolase-fold protein [Gaiellaceae bacterium]|nr:alpha/beta hydrolase-fold protein [Gaiellaceae bacterium]